MLTFIRVYLSKFLLIWLCLTCLLAYGWSQLFGAQTFDPFDVSKLFMQCLIAVTMLAIGSLLPMDEVKMVARRWKSVLGGTCVQYLSMPLLAWLATVIFHIEGGYRIGIIMAGCVPGAMASNMLTMIARGNVSYSVGLTTSATLLSPIVGPLTLVCLLGLDLNATGANAGDSGSWMAFITSAVTQIRSSLKLDAISVSKTLLSTVVCPVVIGFTLSQMWQAWHRAAVALGEIMANVAIIWIIASVVAANRNQFGLLPLLPFVAMMFLNLGGYAAGYFGGHVIGIDAGMRRALTLEVGMQNAGLGTFLARQYFPDEPNAALCCALYTFGCMFTGIILAQYFRHQVAKQTDAGQAEVTSAADGPTEKKNAS